VFDKPVQTVITFIILFGGACGSKITVELKQTFPSCLC